LSIQKNKELAGEKAGYYGKANFSAIAEHSESSSYFTNPASTKKEVKVRTETSSKSMRDPSAPKNVDRSQ